MWLYVVLLNETVLLVPNLCLQHIAFRIYEFLKVTGLKFGSDSSKIIKFDCFWPFLVVKRQVGYFVCAILVVLLETNRLVPWLRQSDHPIQKYHAPRARAPRGKIQFFPQSQRFVFKFCHRTFSRVNHTCLTHWNRFQMPQKYHFAATCRFMVKILIWLRLFKNHQI